MLTSIVDCVVYIERRGASNPTPSVHLPLENLDPQTPLMCQLVSHWQKLWLLAHSRQVRLDKHQQRLKEVQYLNVRGKIISCAMQGPMKFFNHKKMN